MFAFIQNLRRAVSLRILLLPAMLLVAALALAGGEIITTVYTDYTELSLPVPTTTLLVVCQGFDCECHAEVALTDADPAKLVELVASGRGSPGLFSLR
jgi:alpha-D-ribose 1-methylphosphonate 5-triphosphate diphosphatase PhnM